MKLRRMCRNRLPTPAVNIVQQNRTDVEAVCPDLDNRPCTYSHVLGLERTCDESSSCGGINLHLKRFPRISLSFMLVSSATARIRIWLIRAVYRRENKPRLTLAMAYIIRERNYLYEYKLPGQDKLRFEKAVNVDFVPFIRGVRVLCKPWLIFSRISSPNVFTRKGKPHCL